MVGARAYLKEGRFGDGLAAVRGEVGRLMQGFLANGAQPVEPAALLPADVLIDLYGEDMRARAYTTHDPVAGEMMLRPDFTVPVVQMHMAHGAEPARYAYAGSVWRQQEPGSDRPNEYLQVGFEVFDGSNIPAADAEVFAILATALGDIDVVPTTGDMGLIFAAIDALDTNDRRKAALRRHVWRPARFKRLVERYAAEPVAGGLREELLAATRTGHAEQFIAAQGPEIGLRSVQDVAARAEVLLAETNADPLSPGDVALLSTLLALKGTVGSAVAELEAVAARTPAMRDAVELFTARAQELRDCGLDIDVLPFEAAYGASRLEYYDGFVFAFEADKRHKLPPIAQGGRYDALTRVLGNGAGVPAVGGIIRPEALLALKGGVA